MTRTRKASGSTRAARWWMALLAVLVALVGLPLAPTATAAGGPVAAWGSPGQAASGGDLSASTNADKGGAAAPVLAASSPPQPWSWAANPRISERDGIIGYDEFYSGWTANSVRRPDHDNAYWREDDSRGIWKLNAPGTEGAMGGFFVDWAVFTQWRPGQPGNLFLASQATSRPMPRFPGTVNTPAREFLPTLSGRWVLFTRFTRASDTHRVLLYNRETKQLRVLARASGTAAVFAGQVKGDYATWYSWGPEQSNVFRYQISTRTTRRIPKPPGFARQHHPAVAADGTVYYQRRVGRACGSSAELVRYPVGGPPEVLWTYPAGKDGGRLLLGEGLSITVVGCSLPAFRSTDLYRMELPSSP